MIETAHKFGGSYDLTREKIDAFALGPHQHAAARDSGRLAHLPYCCVFGAVRPLCENEAASVPCCGVVCPFSVDGARFRSSIRRSARSWEKPLRSTIRNTDRSSSVGDGPPSIRARWLDNDGSSGVGYERFRGIGARPRGCVGGWFVTDEAVIGRAIGSPRVTVIGCPWWARCNGSPARRV